MSDARDLRARLSLVVVTDRECGPGRAVVEVVRAALAGGAPMIQLRAKDTTAREMVGLARALHRETAAAGALLVVNDRVDVALAAGADGAHLGDDDLPLDAARRIAAADFILGRSVDTPEGAARASRDGADYLGVGPVRATPSKADAGEAIGVAGVARVAQSTDLPVVAIGGITGELVPALISAGAAGVAVIGAVMRAIDPARATADLLAAARARY